MTTRVSPWDLVERLGAAAAAREISLAAAVVLLAEESGGGLTVAGAEDLLADWRNVRRRYETALAVEPIEPGPAIRVREETP